MTVKLDIAEHCVEVEDLGVTLRTLLAVANTGYLQTNRRKWSVKYKGVIIANVQVASTPRIPSKTGG